MKERVISFLLGILVGVILASSYHFILKSNSNSFDGGRGPGFSRERGDFGSGSMNGGSGSMRGDFSSGSMRGNFNGQN